MRALAHILVKNLDVRCEQSWIKTLDSMIVRIDWKKFFDWKTFPKNVVVYQINVLMQNRTWILNIFSNFCHPNSIFLVQLMSYFHGQWFQKIIWRLKFIPYKNISGKFSIWHMFAEIGDPLFSNMIYLKSLWNALTKTKIIFRIGFSQRSSYIVSRLGRFWVHINCLKSDRKS